MNYEVVVGLLEIQCEHFYIASVRSGISASTDWKDVVRRTVTAQFQINDICDSDVHNAEEPLITLLEFALVKNLDGDDRRVLDIAGMWKEGKTMRMNEFEGGWRGSHIEALVPIGIQSLPDDAGRMGLLCIHRDHREWIREAKDLALGQAICGNDCKVRCEEHSLEGESG